MLLYYFVFFSTLVSIKVTSTHTHTLSLCHYNIKQQLTNTYSSSRTRVTFALNFQVSQLMIYLIHGREKPASLNNRKRILLFFLPLCGSTSCKVTLADFFLLTFFFFFFFIIILFFSFHSFLSCCLKVSAYKCHIIIYYQ